MSSDAPSLDLPTLAREVLALFENELRDLRFGDLDASALTDRAERALAASAEVDEARAALDEARARQDEANAELSHQAEKALAYARIFAADDEVLASRIAALDPRPAPKKRRRRKPTAKAPSEEVAELPFEARAS